MIIREAEAYSYIPKHHTKYNKCGMHDVVDERSKSNYCTNGNQDISVVIICDTSCLKV